MLDGADQHGMHAVACQHATAFVARGNARRQRVSLETGEGVEAQRCFAREGDIGAAAGLDLLEARGA